jgi:GNAT superfamily N-acetyltransferase
MLKYLKNIFYPDLRIHKLIEIKKTDNNTYNNISSTTLEYYTQSGNKIGYIKYKDNGQIGLFFIEDEYQNRGIGKQILTNVIDILKINNCKEVWAVTTDNHPFWSNVYNKKFKRRVPAHPSVTGAGYYFELNDVYYDNLTDQTDSI